MNKCNSCWNQGKGFSVCRNCDDYDKYRNKYIRENNQTTSDNEVWVWIDGYDKYQVSNFGDVRSLNYNME